MDIKKRIEQLEQRQKDVIITMHNLRQTIEAADAAKDQMRQCEKENAWIVGALEVLKQWPEDEDAEPEKVTSVGAN